MYQCPLCEVCKVTTPDIRSMMDHHDARHPESPFVLSELFSIGEDRLSSLPDEILINNILSLLPTREPQRTSVLARSWRDLWSYVPCLDLDGSEIASRFPTFPDPDSSKKLVKAACGYAEWVDQTIYAYRGTTALRHFRVLFRLGWSFTRHITTWLEFSLRQGVEALELDGCCSPWGMNPYVFPTSIVDPSRFPNIRLLKSLTLKAVDMTSDSLERLLSACEFLERLQLAQVSGLYRINVTGPISRLKHIHVDHCSLELRSTTIQAPTPDLVSFTYPEHREGIFTVHIQHAPRLVDLRLRAFCRSTVSPLFRYLSQLEALHLVYFSCDKNLDPSHDFPVLIRLKHLKLDFDGHGGSEFLQRKLCCLASLIKISPSLQHLTLEVVGVPQGRKEEFLRELANMRLRLPVTVIEIAGFGWSRKLVCELALSLIRASPSLEKLIIDRRDPLRRGCVLGPYSKKTVKKWENAVEKKIEPELPSRGKVCSHLITLLDFAIHNSFPILELKDIAENCNGQSNEHSEAREQRIRSGGIGDQETDVSELLMATEAAGSSASSMSMSMTTTTMTSGLPEEDTGDLESVC